MKQLAPHCSSWVCAISPHLQVLVSLDKPRQNTQGKEGAIVHNTSQPQSAPPAPKKNTYKKPRAQAVMVWPHHGWGGHGGCTHPLHQEEGDMLWCLILVNPGLEWVLSPSCHSYQQVIPLWTCPGCLWSDADGMHRICSVPLSMRSIIASL